MLMQTMVAETSLPSNNITKALESTPLMSFKRRSLLKPCTIQARRNHTWAPCGHNWSCVISDWSEGPFFLHFKTANACFCSKVYTTMKFEKRLTSAFTTCDRKEASTVYSNDQKLRILLKKVNADFLGATSYAKTCQHLWSTCGSSWSAR